MKSLRFLLIIVLFCTLMGCSSAPNNAQDFTNEDAQNEGNLVVQEDGFDAGYEDGYHCGYEDGFADNDHSEIIHDFEMMIVNLMYDHEYGVVEKLLEYYSEGVESALEHEFGVKDLSAVIEYLDELSNTVIGQCEICSKPVYADEFTFLPDGIECAHGECVHGDSSSGSAKINKDK